MSSARTGKVERKWKEFRNERPRSTNGLYVSINARGIILLNRRAYTELGRPEAVSLLFDEKLLTIGLRPSAPFLATSFPVQPRGASGNMIIRALPFVKANRISLGYTIKFLNPVVEDTVLILDLNLAARATQSPRTGWRKDAQS